MKMNQTQFDAIENWRSAKTEADEAKKVIEKERKARQRVFEVFFPTPEEGTNRQELPENWQLKANCKYSRKVDEAALSAVMEQLSMNGIDPQSVIDWKPSLNTKVYRKLSLEHQRIVDQALVIKPSLPTIEIEPPKE